MRQEFSQKIHSESDGVVGHAIPGGSNFAVLLSNPTFDGFQKEPACLSDANEWPESEGPASSFGGEVPDNGERTFSIQDPSQISDARFGESHA